MGFALIQFVCLGTSIWIIARLVGFSTMISGVIAAASVLPIFLLAFVLITPTPLALVRPLSILSQIVPFVALLALCLALKNKQS